VSTNRYPLDRMHHSFTRPEFVVTPTFSVVKTEQLFDW
jgi:hypothetical protein